MLPAVIAMMHALPGVVSYPRETTRKKDCGKFQIKKGSGKDTKKTEGNSM